MESDILTSFFFSSLNDRLPNVLVGFQLMIVRTLRPVTLVLDLFSEKMASDFGLAFLKWFGWLIYLMKPRIAVKRCLLSVVYIYGSSFFQMLELWSDCVYHLDLLCLFSFGFEISLSFCIHPYQVRIKSGLKRSLSKPLRQWVMVLLSKLSLMAFTLIIILSATSLAEALDMGYMCRRKRLKQKGIDHLQ